MLGKSPSPHSVLSRVPQGSTLGPLLFTVVINELCPKIIRSKFLFFGDDLKMYRNTKSVEDCKSLQADVDSIQQ
jgi:hypothetical protein